MAEGMQTDRHFEELKPYECPCTSPQCLRRIRQLEQEIQRLKSVGYDMLKQRGGWQATGKKPTDSSLEFNNLFDHEVEDLSKAVKESTRMDEDGARYLVAKEFQTIYSTVKSVIFSKVVETLHKVFQIATEEDTDEQLYDICRAYGLLLNASGLVGQLGSIKENQPVYQQAMDKVKTASALQSVTVQPRLLESFTIKSTQLSWDLLTTTPPLLSHTPPSPYHKQWHDKELDPTWNKGLTNYELVYYRPILFMTCEGKVARKGWVGNKAVCGATQEKSGDTCELMSTVDGAGVVCVLCQQRLPAVGQKLRHSTPELFRPRKTVRSTSHMMEAAPSGTGMKAKDETENIEPLTKYYPQSGIVQHKLKSSRDSEEQSGPPGDWSKMKYFR